MRKPLKSQDLEELEIRHLTHTQKLAAPFLAEKKNAPLSLPLENIVLLSFAKTHARLENVHSR